jgi:hypothetical protein
MRAWNPPRSGYPNRAFGPIGFGFGERPLDHLFEVRQRHPPAEPARLHLTAQVPLRPCPLPLPFCHCDG